MGSARQLQNQFVFFCICGCDLATQAAAPLSSKSLDAQRAAPLSGRTPERENAQASCRLSSLFSVGEMDSASVLQAGTDLRSLLRKNGL